MIERAFLDGILSDLAAALDLPEDMCWAAVKKYEALRQFLLEEDEVKGRKPSEVYPQGSFRLGTMVRPIRDEEEYDIDLVYKRDLDKASTTQAELKEAAGRHLAKFAASDDSTTDVEEKRRCWTLHCDAGFHMDVLPAIPDAEADVRSAILITDRDFRKWLGSNPIGYGEWFKGVAASEFESARQRLLEAAKPEEVPDWKVKTTLHRVVQLLKRDRDIRFREDEECRPASILITTLAARAYRPGLGLYDSLLQVIREMPRYIEVRGGKEWVANPMNGDENFADRWEDTEGASEAFHEWLGNLDRDYTTLSEFETRDSAYEKLKGMVGDSLLEEVRESSGGGRLPAPASVPALSTAAHAVAPKWPLALQGKVRVFAEVHRAEGDSRTLWRYRNTPLPKGLWLRFRADTSIRGEYKVHWQVVNTGVEARQNNQLRGGFEDGAGLTGSSRWERTGFRGTHWVEAFVVKDGVCVARSGKYFVLVQ